MGKIEEKNKESTAILNNILYQSNIVTDVWTYTKNKVIELLRYSNTQGSIAHWAVYYTSPQSL